MYLAVSVCLLFQIVRAAYDVMDQRTGTSRLCCVRIVSDTIRAPVWLDVTCKLANPGLEGDWLSLHEPVRPADGLICCRLKQINIPRQREGERQRGGVQRVSAHACALCTSILHVGCVSSVVAGDEQCNVVRLVRRIIKIL